MTDQAYRADRALGAILFGLFGTAWLELWCWFAEHDHIWIYVLIALLATALVITGVRIRSRYKRTGAAAVASVQEQRTGRIFHLINAGQWVVIFLGISLLNHFGLGQWAVPLIILVIGVHFLPLAHLFRNPPHYVTGTVLILFAVAYPFIATDGPASTVGPLGAGIILWCSALWALLPHPRAAA